MNQESAVRYVHLVESDWPQVQRLWSNTEGLVLRDDNNLDSFRRLLKHSPGLSMGARAGAALIGALLAGYDGKRGYLYHMAVAHDWRRRGVGSGLAHHALLALRAAGAERIHLLVSPDNAVGITFWQRMGLQLRGDVELMTLSAL